MRRSTVLSLPPQLVFPDLVYANGTETFIITILGIMTLGKRTLSIKTLTIANSA